MKKEEDEVDEQEEASSYDDCVHASCVKSRASRIEQCRDEEM